MCQEEWELFALVPLVGDRRAGVPVWGVFNGCAARPQVMLFLLQRSQISKVVSLDVVDYTSFPMPLGKTKCAVAIDYDPVEDMV